MRQGDVKTVKQGVHHQFGSQSTSITFYQVAINTGGSVIIQAKLLPLSGNDQNKMSNPVSSRFWW